MVRVSHVSVQSGLVRTASGERGSHVVERVGSQERGFANTAKDFLNGFGQAT